MVPDLEQGIFLALELNRVPNAPGSWLLPASCREQADLLVSALCLSRGLYGRFGAGSRAHMGSLERACHVFLFVYFVLFRD